MAGLGDWLQQVARSLEEAGARQPGDDLRARLGYGTGEEDEEELESDSVWAPETSREPETTRRSPAHGSDTAQGRETARSSGTPWTPRAARPSVPEPTPAMGRTLDPYRSSHPGGPHRVGLSSPAAPPHSPAAPTSLLSRRVRAHLHTPDALREAFVVKELLDRPLGLRRGR